MATREAIPVAAICKLVYHAPHVARLPVQVVWGEAFDPEAQAKKKQERIEQRQKEEKEAYERREA